MKQEAEKNYENEHKIYKSLRNEVLRIREIYLEQVSACNYKMKSLREEREIIKQAKNAIEKIGYIKPLSAEEYDNFLLYTQLLKQIDEIKTKIEKGYEFDITFDQNQSTTNVFAFENEHVNPNYKLYNQNDTERMQEEIKFLQTKIEEFSCEQIDFFKNIMSWQGEIETKLKRCINYQNEYGKTKKELCEHIAQMRKTKKEYAQAENARDTFYNRFFKEEKTL